MSAFCPTCRIDLPTQARFCPRCGQAVSGGSASDFQTWRRGVYRRQAVFCGIFFIVGLFFLEVSPVTAFIVSGLSLIGLAVSTRRLTRLAAR